MAILKIDQVQGKINTGNVPRTSALALPLSLANQQAQGFKAFSDGLVNLYAAQKKEEDLNEAQSITDSLSIDLIKSYKKHSSNTDLEVALEGFNEDVNYKNFEDLGSNKRVKKEVRNYINKFQRKYSLDLLGKVTENHQSITKARKDKNLSDLVKEKAAGGANAIFADRELNTFFTDPANITYYGADGLAKKKEEIDNQVIELTYINKGQTGEFNLFDDAQREELRNTLPMKSQQAVIDKVRSDWLSNTLALKDEQIFNEKKDKQFKIETFTTALLAINDHRLMPTEENFGRLPSLNNLYDLKQSGAINSTQYDFLLEFKANKRTLDDETTLQIVNTQFALADNSEMIDSLQEDVNLNPDITKGLSAKSIIKFNALADKYKNDTRFAIEDKKFRKRLDIASKRIEETSGAIDLSNLFGASSTDYDFLQKAQSRKDEYDFLTLQKNFTPEQAYTEIIKNLDETELPELHDLEQPISGTIDNFAEEVAAHPSDAFERLRQKVADAKKMKIIDMTQFKEDLRRIDIIEDTFNARNTIFGNVKDAIGDTFGAKEEN